VEIYDSEEQQVAAIKRWWSENSISVMAGAIIGIALIAGWNFWKSYKEDQSDQASALYEELLSGISNNKKEEVDKISERLSQQYGSTAYASYAALMLAKTRVEQGDLDSAKDILKKQMKESGSVELKNVARIRLIKLLHATGENEQGLQLIAEANQADIGGFAARYNELKGDLYVALDRLGEARTAYQSALREGKSSPLLQFKLDDITATEVIEGNADKSVEADVKTEVKIETKVK
jgi:predicted negative regulator of RcsB-dependent stress response